MVSKLAQINAALKKLGHPGIHLKLIDDDVVEQHNVGRQLYSLSDIGKNKAIVCIERINRFFGTIWEALPIRVDYPDYLKTNIIITKRTV